MISRRKFIRNGAVIGGIGMAGCSGSGSSGGSGGDGSDGGGGGSDGSSDGGSTPTPGSDGGDGQTVYKAAVSLPTLGYQWFPRVQHRFNKLVEERDDLEGTVYDAGGNLSQQISDIETAITKGVDFLIVDPLKGEGVGPAIEQAKEANIPVVNLDREILDKDVATYVAADNVAMGRRGTELCLQFMKERADKDQYNIIQLRGVPGSSVAGDRTKGFEKAIEQNSELNVLADQTANWSKGEAISLMEDFVVNYGDKIDGVFCQNDQMAIGVYEVLRNNDMDAVPITGIDGLKQWLKTFADNPEHGTIGQLPEKMTEVCVDFGIKLVQGKDVPNRRIVESPALYKGNGYKDYMQKYLSEF